MLRTQQIENKQESEKEKQSRGDSEDMKNEAEHLIDDIVSMHTHIPHPLYSY